MVCVALCVVGWTGSREAGGRGEWKEESRGQRRLAGWGGGSLGSPRRGFGVAVIGSDLNTVILGAVWTMLLGQRWRVEVRSKRILSGS